MRNLKKILCVLLAVLMLCGCMGTVAFANDDHPEHDICHPDPGIGTTGTFNAINYNVDGLPIPPSETADGKDAFADSFIIGQKLNAMNYDIVAIQEDFNYDLYLRDQMTNYVNKTDDYDNIIARHQSDHAGGVPLGDGLNIFSRYYMYNCDRVTWEQSAGILTDGSDQLTYKGIQVTTIELAKGYYLDVYNIHVDAYSGEESVAARQAQFTQLANYIKKHSVYDETTGTYDHAVLVTGDFNANIYKEEEEKGDAIVKNLLEAAHLNDAWAVKTINSIEENPENYDAYYYYAEHTNLTYTQAWGHYDSVERFCYASGNGIKISCDTFAYKQIKDDSGRSLSDHSAAIATFTWEIVEKAQDIGHNHDEENTQQNQSFLLKFLNYIASIIRAIGLLLQDYMNWGSLSL